MLFGIVVLTVYWHNNVCIHDVVEFGCTCIFKDFLLREAGILAESGKCHLSDP